MANLSKAPTTNFTQTTLNGALDNSATTITLTDASAFQAPGYAVINRVDSAGNATPNDREVIYFGGKSSNDLTSVTRAADNSTARSHSDGAVVETTLTVGMWNDLRDAVAAAMTADGYLLPIASPASISHIEGDTLAFASVASIDVVEARVYAGNRGQFYWSRTGALATVRNAVATDTHYALQRSSKNLSLVTTYVSVLSAPSLTPLELDISYGSSPTGDFASIYSTRPFIDIGEYDITSSATPGVLGLTSLASGALLRKEVLMHGDSGGIMTQLVADERQE